MDHNKKTLRLVLPQWQGGNNPNYIFGSQLLVHIAPPDGDAETIQVPVNQDYSKDLIVGNGIEGESALLTQMDETYDILERKNPDKVIVFGGDCAVSQVPFDYLNGKYGKNMGILWLDAHPDVATMKDSTRLHEMVLGNLIGKGAPQFAEKVKNPVKSENVMLAGLIYGELRERDQMVNTMKLRYAQPAELLDNSIPVLDWIKENHIQHIAVHFDLDVLSPNDFRSIYPAEPYLDGFGAAIGEMTLAQVVRLLNDVSGVSEIVGLTIAEHLPWDAIRLRNALSQISIFGN